MSSSVLNSTIVKVFLFFSFYLFPPLKLLLLSIVVILLGVRPRGRGFKYEPKTKSVRSDLC